MGAILYLGTFILLLYPSAAISKFPKLILISFDGFRHDLLNETLVPNIYRWAKQSTWFVNGSQSQDLTFTTPNHMSIVTGQYEEDHNIVANGFSDPAVPGKKFNYFNIGGRSDSLDERWYTKVNPLWLQNERADSGRISSSYYWPGGEAYYPDAPHRPTEYRMYISPRELSDWKKDVDAMIESLTRSEKPANFLAWYVVEPDETLHYNGFYNGAFDKKMKDMDDIFTYFLEKLDEEGIREEFDIILTADHGHAEIIDAKHILCVSEHVDSSTFDRGDFMIYPKTNEQAKEIYENLTKAVKDNNYGIDIYMKEDFPRKFHYTHSDRIGRIILRPHIGYYVYFFCSKDGLERSHGADGRKNFHSSGHGMSPLNPEMRALLVMSGPSFETNKQIGDIPQNMDLYPLMCHILGLTPTPNNGTMEIVKKALKNHY